MKNTNRKFHIKRGDKVKVIAGNSKGKEGLVMAILTQKNLALIEGLNIVSRHMKPSANNPNGGIIKKEAPIHISNLALIEPATGKPTRIGRRLNANGKLQRYSKKTNQFI